jgi:hypothetical protein
MRRSIVHHRKPVAGSSRHIDNAVCKAPLHLSPAFTGLLCCHGFGMPIGTLFNTYACRVLSTQNEQDLPSDDLNVG